MRCLGHGFDAKNGMTPYPRIKYSAMNRGQRHSMERGDHLRTRARTISTVVSISWIFFPKFFILFDTVIL